MNDHAPKRDIDAEMLRLAELAKQVLRERGWTDEEIAAGKKQAGRGKDA
jgi:hypothetical protein